MKKLTKKDLQNLKQRTLIEEFHIDHYGQSELDFEIVSFYFETAIYVDIMSIFKVKNKGKKCLQECEFILFAFLRNDQIIT